MSDNGSRVVLGIGDGYSSDGYIDLTDYFIGGTLTVALPDVSMQLEFADESSTIADAQRAINAINGYLTLAAEASRPSGHGTRVVFSFQLGDGTWAYCDVTGGYLAVPPETLSAPYIMSGWLQGVTLSLTCLPYGRLPSIPYTQSATFTHGDTDAVYAIRDVPGDAPALCEVAVQDVSTSSAIINRVRVARRSGRQLADDAFAFVHDATNESPATEGALTGALGGNGSTVTTTTNWQTMASFTVAERGMFELWARVRDESAAGSSSVLNWQAGYPFSGPSGTLAAGSYRIVNVALNGTSVIAVSEAHSITISGSAANDDIHIAWDAVTGATDYRTYVKKDTAAYAYHTWGDTTTAHTITSISGYTPGSPPSVIDDAATSAQFRVVLSLSSGTVVYAQPAVSSVLANSMWEHLCLFRGILPVVSRSEYRDDQTTRVLVQAKAANGDSLPDVDVDALFVLPVDECKQTAEYYGLALATKRTWRLETNRYGEPSAYLVDGSGDEHGDLVSYGSLYLEPGPVTNLLYVMPESTGGTSDVTDIAFKVSATVTPRWKTLGGDTP